MTETDAPARTEPLPARRQRPLTDYWDVRTASWQRREPRIPQPRTGA